MVKNLSCVSDGSLKRFPHTFTTDNYLTTALLLPYNLKGGALVNLWDGYQICNLREVVRQLLGICEAVVKKKSGSCQAIFR